MSTDTVIKTDWCFIGIDDTSSWQLKPCMKRHVKRILTVYFYNRSSHTYRCEGLPSYWLSCVDFRVHFNPGTTAQEREDIQDRVDEVPKLEYDHYQQVHNIDVRAKKHRRWHHVVGDLSEELDQVDELWEIWHNNPKF